MSIKFYPGGIIVLLLFAFSAGAQELPARHNPRIDLNLSPRINPVINPVNNASINPKLNWNINPGHTNSLSPEHNAAINPRSNQELNPSVNNTINPMYQHSLFPKNAGWRGLYMYDSTDALIGYITVASQNVMLAFDSSFEWVGYFVKASPVLYNYFDLRGAHTGIFLCNDSRSGYNLFNREGEWTGKHIK